MALLVQLAKWKPVWYAQRWALVILETGTMSNTCTDPVPRALTGTCKLNEQPFGQVTVYDFAAGAGTIVVAHVAGLGVL